MFRIIRCLFLLRHNVNSVESFSYYIPEEVWKIKKGKKKKKSFGKRRWHFPIATIREEVGGAHHRMKMITRSYAHICIHLYRGKLYGILYDGVWCVVSKCKEKLLACNKCLVMFAHVCRTRDIEYGRKW